MRRQIIINLHIITDYRSGVGLLGDTDPKEMRVYANF